MCGFLSAFGEAKRRYGCLERKKKAGLLSHRGPDDFQTLTRDLYEVLFWRLSIVDEEGGKQPMVSPDGGVVVLFNGEIYNFQDLRSELMKRGATFATRSDTEVIQKAYEIFGIDCFSRFEGMFAVCLIDERKKQVVLARDCLGVKPLYFHHGSGELIVSSEQKALVAGRASSPRLNREAFLQYLVFQTVLDSGTLFEGISKVPPGNVLIFDLNSLRLVGIHANKPLETLPTPASYREYQKVLHELLMEQVALTLDTSLKISFHLSGGIDSNTLVSMCRHLDPDREITCVTSVVEEEKDPEWEFIQQSAEIYRVDLRKVSLSERSFFEAFDEVMFYLDEPTGDPGVVAQFLVNERASQDGKIVFSGQGLDEMFFGYMRNLVSYVVDRYGLDALNPEMEAHSRLPAATREFFRGWEDFLKGLRQDPMISPQFILFKKLCRFDPFDRSAGLADEFWSPLREVALDTLLRLQSRSRDLHDFMINAETAIQLPSLLHMEDRASMRYSLETRVPFCTSSVLELSRKGRLDWNFNKGIPKGIIRDTFKDILPSHISRRLQKVGRPIPFRRWLQGDYGKPYLEDLKKKRELLRELTRTDILEYALNHPNPYDRTAWALLSLSKWMDLYQVTV
jgi:asparagine synthase (glutamine-hydrolysing)